MKVLRRLIGLLRGELHVEKIIAREAAIKKLKAGKHTVDVEDSYIHISGATPYVRFEGTETGGADKGIKEDAGSLKIYDFAGAGDVMDFEGHASRHAYGGDDAIADDARRFSQIDKSFDNEVSVALIGGATYTIEKGIYQVSLGDHTKVEYTPDGGTTWRDLIPEGEGGVVISDGSKVRLHNTSTEPSSENTYLLPVR